MVNDLRFIYTSDIRECSLNRRKRTVTTKICAILNLAVHFGPRRLKCFVKGEENDTKGEQTLSDKGW